MPTIPTEAAVGALYPRRPPPGGKGRNGRYYGNIIKGLGHCELCAMEPRETSPNPIRQSGRMATPASESNPLS
jgi:hypothetical protein